jgi:hypothetical protein
VNPHAPIARVVGCWGATCRSHKAAHGSSAWSAAVRRQHSEYGDRYGGYDASARAQMVCWNLQGTAMLTLQETAARASQQRASFSC